MRQDFVADQGQQQGDRCHHRCRRKTFKTGHQAPTPSTCSAWKTLFDQTTGSTTLLPACNAIKGLLIGSTHQTKYCLKHWLTFSGTIGFVQIILAQKRPALKFPFWTRRSEQSSSHKHLAILLDFFNSAISTLSNAQKKHLAWHLVGLCPNYLLPPP